ncbi:MAG TPA: hypothetical protein VFX03_13270, partial [Thermomicrobiales bacterium]|nr:hypothetical protein [Thermomicrobiales bacterium]
KGLSPGAAANELFLSTCGLMATGARTVLISRWRTGGQTSYDLVREFVQELPETTASNAWQRSIELVSRQPLERSAEPRFKGDSQHAPPLAENPFFWAGYLLVDTGSAPRLSDEPEPDALPLALQAVPAAGDNAPGDNVAGGAAEMKPEKDAQAGVAKPGDAEAALGLRRQPEGANLRRQRPPGNAMPDAGQNPADAREPENALPGFGGGDPAAEDPRAKAKGKRQPRAKVERKKPPPKKGKAAA